MDPTPPRNSYFFLAAVSSQQGSCGDSRPRLSGRAKPGGSEPPSLSSQFSPSCKLSVMLSAAVRRAKRSSLRSRSIPTFRRRHLNPTAPPQRFIRGNPCESVANEVVLTSPNSPDRPQRESSGSAPATPAAPETPHAAPSDTNTRPNNNCPTGDWRAHAQWSPAAIS